MGMTNPDVNTEPLDKLSKIYPEGQPFFLEGVRLVKVNTKDYGPGEMVVVKVRGHQYELGVWGVYLTAQAKSVVPDDLNKWYVLTRETVAGFGKNGRPVKLFKQVANPDDPAVAAAAQLAVDQPDDGDDIPF